MKKNVLIFGGVLLMAITMYNIPYSGISKETALSKAQSSSELKLQLRGDRYYKLGKNIPFTGKRKVSYEKKPMAYQNEYNVKTAYFENDYEDGILKITKYYNKSGVFEYSVNNI